MVTVPVEQKSGFITTLNVIDDVMDPLVVVPVTVITYVLMCDCEVVYTCIDVLLEM